MIRSVTFAYFTSPHRGANLSGEIVWTDDGQRWFHPHNGDAPWRLADAKPEDKTA